MKKTFSFLLVSLFLFSNIYASQSTITESEGYACMGDDKSRKQTEQAALSDAMRKAAEAVLTYLKSETHVKNFELEKDLVSAYTNSKVKVIQEIEKGWYKDPSLGDCYKVKIKAEVVPDEKAMENIAKETQAADDPSAPLHVRVWTDKKEYRQNEKIKIYMKGNKPFYARVLYKDASGDSIQILPNPHRQDNYFNGATVYEIPSGNDKFILEVNPPFGKEEIAVYAGTSQLGDLSLENAGDVYQVKTGQADIGIMTRGIKIKIKDKEKEGAPSEFVEEKTEVKTGK